MKKFIPTLRLFWVSLLGAILVSTLHSPLASAHWADLSVADVVLGEQNAQMTLTIPTSLVSFADADGDGSLSTAEFQDNQSQIQALFQQKIALTNQAGAMGALRLDPQTLQASAQVSGETPDDHISFLLKYRWAEPLQALTMRYELFPPESANPQCLATLSQGDDVRNVIFRPETTTFTFGKAATWPQQFASFLRLGVEHIFTGYDHILFLLALLLPGSQLIGGQVVNGVKLVTAFTLAHSITLALAVFNLVVLPTTLVESLIALSIVYVAVENLVRKRFRHRWGITFGFGLIHGLGFANILRDLAGTQSNLLLSLVSFNLGVELGQVAIVLAMFLLLFGARSLAKSVVKARHVVWERTLRYGLSVGLIVMGSVWFAERVLAALVY